MLCRLFFVMKYILSLIIFGSLACIGNEFSPPKSILKKATSNQLHKKQTWRQLIGFYSNSPLVNKSDIKSRSFFLASNGHKSPKAELLATITGFYAPIPSDQNQHPQCRFPARYQWLKKHINLHTYPHPKPNCHDYNNWINNTDVQSYSLLFVNGYLSNPSSFHGHLLIRFNNSPAEFLNNTTNYGAIMPQNENPILYIVKGILGGYDATYSDQQFYRYNHNYVETALRDIWAYKLQLTKEERTFLTAHNWELLGQRFTYYFFRDNCAYRIGRLLELVTKAPIVPEGIPWALPYQIVKNISEQPNMIANIQYIPSREERLIQSYKGLSEKLKTIFKSIISKKTIDPNTYKTLSISEKTSLIDALIEYLGLKSITNKHHKLNTFKNIIQKKRIQLPIEKKAKSYSGTPIHLAQKSSLIEGSIIQENSSIGLGLRLRPSNNDILSNDIGRIPNTIVEMGDTKIKAMNNQIKLDYISFIQVLALNTAQTDLDELSKLAWKLHIGMDQDLTNKKSDVFFMDMGIGKSIQVSNSVIYTLMTLKIQGGANPIGFAPSVGLINDLSKRLKSHLSISQLFFNKQAIALHQYELRFILKKNSDLRFKLLHGNSTQSQISYGIYW